MKFNVTTEKFLAGNALKSGDRNATRMQSKDEHDRLINPERQPEYLIISKMPAGPAKEAAIAELIAKCRLREAEEAKYWTEDETPRRPIAQSSSWIGDITFDPRSNMITIALGEKGSSKTVYGNEKAAADIVNSSSIGEHVREKYLK